MVRPETAVQALARPERPILTAQARRAVIQTAPAQVVAHRAKLVPAPELPIQVLIAVEERMEVTRHWGFSDSLV